MSAWAGLSLGVPAAAVTVGFDRITNNSSADAAGQLSVNVFEDYNIFAGGVLLDFTVAPGPNSSANVKEIYFSDITSLFAPPPTVVSQSPGVKFVGGSASPGDLPGGNNASPSFSVTAGLLAQGSGNNGTGLTIGELLRIGLAYSGIGFSQVLAALDSGAFRIGLHVGSLVAGKSDSFVSASPVPLPAAVWLLLSGFGILGIISRRRRVATARR